MTAQIKDCLLYKNNTFEIVRVSKKALFNPADYGIRTVCISSSCGSGLYCTYEIIDNFLQIQKVYLALEYLETKRIELGKGIRLFGKIPSPLYKNSQEHICDNLEQLVKFTGGILIGANFIRELLRSWYIPDLYKDRTVHELIFESGRLVQAIDCSKKISQLSNRLIGKEIDIIESREIRKWSKDFFN